LDIVRKTVLLGLIMTNHEQKLSPVLLNGLPTVVMDAAVYLLSGAQPTMALRGLGSCLSEVKSCKMNSSVSRPTSRTEWCADWLSAIEWLPSATERLSPQRVRAEASCAKSFLAHTLFPLTAAECVDSKV
jgi:hypothetical protein